MEVLNFLSDFADVFFKNSEDIGHTNIVEHTINAGEIYPMKQPARRMPAVKRVEAARRITDMHERGIIEPSTSPWSSPVVLVRKKDGSTHFSVDYRKLNNITKKDSYPLPSIDDALEALEGAT